MAENIENYTSKFKVDISDLKKGIAEANKTIKTANAEFKNATAGMDSWSDSADGLTAKIKQQESVVEAEKKKLELLKEQLIRLNQNQEDGKKIISELTKKYEDAVQTYGKTSKEAKEYAKQLTDTESAQERNTKAAEALELKIINQDTAIKNAEAQVSKYQSALQELQNHTETLTEKVQRQQSELDDLKQKYANVAAEQGKNSDEAKELAGKISELSGELKENRTKLSDAEKAADEFDESLEDVGDSADKTTKGGLHAFSVALGNLASKVITAVIDKMKEMVFQTGQVGISFDSAMSQVAGTFGYTVEQLSDDTSEMSKDMQDLRDYSKEIAETTKFSATEAAEGMNYAAMAGWKSGEILEGYKGIVDLAAASGEELALTADIVTDGLTAMGYSAADASHFADVMAKTSASANTNVSIMGESFKYSTTVAGLFGKEADGTNRKVENLALGLGLMANAGIKGSQSGNVLKNSLSGLSNPTDEQAIAMERLGLAITEMRNVIDSEEVEDAQKAYEKAADTLQKAESKVSDKTFDLQQKQLAYNTAVAKYGENSSQAQSAMLKLQQAETHLTEAQNAQLSAQNALAESQEALALAQQGTMKAVATGETAFANADGSMKSLKAVYDALRSSMSAVNVELIDSEGNMRDADDIINELSQSEEGLTQAEQLKNASILFGKQNLAGVLAIINASEEDYNKLTEAIYNSDGAAAAMSETMIDNLGGDLTILKSKLQAIQIAIYEKFEPALRKIAEKVG
ncbi:MAG: phage tail tape measure protein, partial [Oscillospiraceae bacterium]|nr:phage tail tape measure protein [Oscillospiraceae bacterium]